MTSYATFLLTTTNFLDSLSSEGPSPVNSKHINPNLMVLPNAEEASRKKTHLTAVVCGKLNNSEIWKQLRSQLILMSLQIHHFGTEYTIKLFSYVASVTPIRIILNIILPISRCGYSNGNSARKKTFLTP